MTIEGPRTRTRDADRPRTAARPFRSLVHRRRHSRPAALGVVSVLLAGFLSVTGVTGAATAVAAPAATPLRVDFAAATTVPAPGYTLDYGQAYGVRTGVNQGTGNSYGWVADGTATPLDLSTSGRVRTGTPTVDAKQASFMHMSLDTAKPGAWEAELADGWYKVEVGLGDATNVYNSTHSVSVEGEYPIAPFVPNATVRVKTGTSLVLVSDGRLTVRPQLGSNVKITYISIEDAPAPVTRGFPIKIDFGSVSSTPAPGYTLDYGQRYGAKAGDIFGWVGQGTTEPVDLVGQGRQRAATANPDPRLTNFVQMQAAGAPAGAWQISVPNGTYRVSVAVGEANNIYDSTHAVTVNGDKIITPYVPNFNNKFKTATTDVVVTDEKITVDAIGGTNTKLDYIDILDWSNPSAPVLPLNVDFGTSGSAVPAGYINDSGLPYGARSGGFTFGWVGVGTSTPLNMTAQGRLRSSTYTTDPRMLSLVQMQALDGTAPGSWEVLLPNGTYTVEVAAGDPTTSYNSAHTINVEGVRAITTFGPSTNNRLRTANVVAIVADGRLTIDAVGGTNTKILYVSIDLIDASRPRVSSVYPGGDEVDVVRDLSVTTELILPNGAINPNTVTTSTVTLKNNVTGDLIPASVNTSGGGDVLVLTPKATLAADTMYRFEITDGVQDILGKPFLPHRSLFKTGVRVSGTGINGVAFTQEATVATGQLYTSVTFGPDGKLYAATLNGYIQRFPVAADGTLGLPETIETVRNLNNGEDRTIVGLTFDPAATASNLILWVTDNFMYTGSADVPDWSSKVDRLTGPNLENGQNVLVNLPRSAHDHEANSIAFGPDGALYFPMGSNTGMGYQDLAWGNRPEVALSGAILRLDTTMLPSSLPLDVRTTDVAGGTYNPYAAGAPLTLYATGVRNAFDLLWHSNGQLYAPTNGSAAGSNLPAVSNPLPAGCANRTDIATNGPYSYTGPGFATIMYNPAAQTDMIHRVVKGGYYGHPNPTRCEFISYGGNPTTGVTPWEDAAYPAGVNPDPNFRASDVYDAGMHASANGTIEYKSDVFGALLKGKLLIVRYSASKDIIVADPNGPNNTISGTISGTTGLTGFSEPLDLVENPNGSGILYVTELGSYDIKLLRPAPPAAPAG